ncbi:DUF6049 family protein [Nocardioides lijunqiniae]|uniref:DUF6049 family protein n=1 Tax=Nocardioides lijunqiniae TaxID=2760832 RepID=UPI001877DC4F
MVRSPLRVRALGATLGAAACLAPALSAVPASATAPSTTTTTATPATVTAAPGAARAEEPEPLSITLDDVSPSTVPRRGPIVVTGTVTNVDAETWSTVNLYPFIGNEPMRSTAALEAATRVPVDQAVGQRITDRGPLDTVEELAPGQSYDFTITVRRGDYALPSRGVYWFGVHALAEGPQPRDLVAEGRARTLLPYVPERLEGSVETALVVPLRRFIDYAADGSLADEDGWRQTLDDGGRLRGRVDLGAASGASAVTWLVDPALLDAVRRLSLGNPPRSLEPTQPPGEGEEPEDGEPTPSETISPEEEEPEAEGEELSPEAAQLARVATDWLADLREAISGDQVLTLPYGDVDVAGAARHDPDLVELAVRREGVVLPSWGVPSSPAMGSPGGYLDADGIALAGPDTTVLLSDRMFAADPPAVVTAGRQRLVVASSGAAAGGPLPGPRLSSVALRQRLVSEAAVRFLAREPRPLVMVVPPQWIPEDPDGFFDALDPAWLDLTTVGDVADGTAGTVDADRLAYPRREADSELDAAAFSAVRRLASDGETLQNLLTRNDQVAGVVLNQSLAGASYGARIAPDTALSSLTQSRRWIDERLGAVEVDAPPGVTLSGGNGSLAATVTNTLDEPVTVVISATSDSGVDVDDSEPQQLGAGASATVLLPVHRLRQGVHQVTLRAVDAEGNPLGSADSFPIRSAQVSTVIWAILGTGTGILFLAIGARLVRRIRHRHDVAPEEGTA